MVRTLIAKRMKNSTENRVSRRRSIVGESRGEVKIRGGSKIRRIEFQSKWRERIERMEKNRVDFRYPRRMVEDPSENGAERHGDDARGWRGENEVRCLGLHLERIRAISRLARPPICVHRASVFTCFFLSSFLPSFFCIIEILLYS